MLEFHKVSVAALPQRMNAPSQAYNYAAVVHMMRQSRILDIMPAKPHGICHGSGAANFRDWSRVASQISSYGAPFRSVAF